MAIRGLKKWALLLTFWVALQCRWARATDLTGDNLTLTGTADIQGNTISLGTGASSYPGWQGAYTDGTTSYVDFTATRSSNIWRWWQNGASTAQLQLKLDNNNKLTLYDQSSTPVAKITLDPLGASTFANSLTVTGSITVNGIDNQMPNQTLTGANSVLTEGLADSRYLSNTGIAIGSVTVIGGETYQTVGLIGGTASAPFAFAEGYGSTASGKYSIAMGSGVRAIGSSSMAIGAGTIAYGDYSIAMGHNTTASGLYSMSIGDGTTASGNYATANGYQSTASGRYSLASGSQSTASGRYSLASGYQSTASSYFSTAMGWGATASGNYATAIGYYSTASGDSSTASGRYLQAQAYNSFVIGAFNVGGGSTTSWVASDTLFEIGNGADSSHLSDALVVYKNGNATLQGTLTTSMVRTTTAAGDIPMFGH